MSVQCFLQISTKLDDKKFHYLLNSNLLNKPSTKTKKQLMFKAEWFARKKYALAFSVLFPRSAATLHTAKTALDSKFYWFPYFCMTNNELKKWIGMFCSRYHGFVSWPCPSYVPELWCQNCTFYSGCWAVLWCGSSTGYGTLGTHGARGGRYVHLQHSAATWPEQIQIVQAAICSDCTFYAIWCWMCLHKVAAGGWMLQQRPALAGSPIHFTEQENCWKQFLLKLFEVHYDYTSI